MMRGQLSIAGLLMIILLIILVAHFMPTVNNTINFALGYVSSDVGALWQLIPLFLIGAILSTIAIFAEPIRQRIFG